MPSTQRAFLESDLSIRAGASGETVASLALVVTTPAGEALRIPLSLRPGEDGTAHIAGSLQSWAVEADWAPQSCAVMASWSLSLKVRWEGPEPAEAGLRFTLDLTAEDEPWWLIPGLFYGENRPEHCTRLYPRYSRSGHDQAHLTSPTWSFRSDRAAVPMVFACTQTASLALATDEVGAAGLSGMGFAGGGQPAIWLDFPYREEPVTYLEPGRTGGPDRTYATWDPGEQKPFSLRVFAGPPDRHAYDPMLRALYDAHAPSNPLNPWVGLAESAALAAHGLERWHYLPGDAILMETTSFDREGGKADRKNMHVAWVSGAPYAGALLDYGRRTGEERHVEAGLAVLDKIAGGLAPCGAFWGEWRHDRGWSSGWTPRRGWLHPRTLGEATLFMLRAALAERVLGIEHPGWIEAVRSNLDYVSGVQREDGNLGGYYDAATGEVVAWEGAGGLTWVAALAEGASALGRREWLESARRAGEYYERFVRQEFIHGAPEDVHLAPTSEDGYAAVLAYLALYEATGEPRWLDVARRSADWMLTFRLTYNLDFPRLTFLRQHDFRSRGADIASPSNQHLHAYGLIATREMLSLADLTGDAHYRDRTRDNIACFLQFIAREDGDFNAYKGMASERFYNTNCFQPKGMMLTLSHSWSVGMVLIAALAAEGRAEELGLPA